MENQRWEESEKRREEKKREEKRREEERRSEKRKSQKKEDAGAGKGRKVAIHPVPEGRKVGSLKRRVRGPAGQMRDEKLHTVAARSIFASEKAKNSSRHARSTFGSCDVGKVHAVVARSTCPSQNAQSTPFLEHFWKLRCRTRTRGYGAKHMSKPKCAKHNSFGALLEVEMSKKHTPLWLEAHFQVKMLKTLHFRTTFEGSDVVLRGRRKGFCTLPKVSKMQNVRA